ncbi:hypothetical protein B0H63DRAFT_453474 [Podospora didyma]|uniref:Uncharacterized protein n=1 Tax=Podospora didyma TaxID=330526 RepID=A0AAE0N6M9_9PEZI|nr:hypothetical protein B0H63DRAFT_453474 [Podospora didyma]
MAVKLSIHSGFAHAVAQMLAMAPVSVGAAGPKLLSAHPHTVDRLRASGKVTNVENIDIGRRGDERMVRMMHSLRVLCLLRVDERDKKDQSREEPVRMKPLGPTCGHTFIFHD